MPGDDWGPVVTQPGRFDELVAELVIAQRQLVCAVRTFKRTRGEGGSRSQLEIAEGRYGGVLASLIREAL
jgi:hypothetical protein